MYKSRHSSTYPQVRGGFSLFSIGTPQGVSGLGDTTDYSDFTSFLSTLSPDMQALQNSYLAANPPSVGTAGSGISLNNIPTAAWLALLGTGFLLFAYSK